MILAKIKSCFFRANALVCNAWYGLSPLYAWACLPWRDIYQGPVRGGFCFFGLVFGAALAGPLSALTKHLLPLVGLVHPIWGIFVPQTIAFVLVVVIFMVAGEVLHQKIAFVFKYKVDDKTRISWERMYSCVGFSIGFVNGSICFLLLMIPVYVGGYFTTEAQVGPGDPASARFLTRGPGGVATNRAGSRRGGV